MSNYPFKIDDVISLPLVRDKFTKITAGIINRLRESIVNIENEMGIKPSKNYIDVKTRIDYLENAALNMTTDDSVIRVSDVARPGQTLVRNNPRSKWVPDTDFIARSIKTSGQLESGLINAAGISNGLTVLDGKMIFRGLQLVPEKSNIGGGSIYFDKTDNHFKFSENGGDYMLLGNLRSITVQPNFIAHGDLAGDHLRQTVIGIGKIPIKDIYPIDCQALIYDNFSWVPGTNFGNNNVITTGKTASSSIQITSLIGNPGVIKSDASGNVSSSLILDADVDLGASISGKKIVSNFGNQDVYTSGKITSDGYASVNKIFLDSGLGPSISGGEGQPTSISDKIGSLYTDSASGLVYMYMGVAVGWKLIPGVATGQASGDLYGQFPNPQVGYLNGIRVSSDGYNLTTNGTLQIDSGSLVVKPIMLDGGASHVVGVLPKSKQKPQKMGGDVGGYTNSSKVSHLRGVPVIQSDAIANNSCIIYDASLTLPSWVIRPASGVVSLSGVAGNDLDGYYPNPVVNRINGASIKTKSDVKNINEIFVFSGAQVQIPGITSAQSYPSVFAVIPARSYNINLTIQNSSDNILQVFCSDGYHIFGDVPGTQGSNWFNYGINSLQDINGKLIKKSNEFDYRIFASNTMYNASGVQSPSSGAITSSYASDQGGYISYSISGGGIIFNVFGKLKKSIILVLTSKVNTSAISYGSSCYWYGGYAGNIIPRKGYILQSTGTSSPHLLYRPINLSSNNIVGLIPTANQEIMQMFGDVDGYTNDAHVKKLQNIPIDIDPSNVDDGYVFGLTVVGGLGKWQAFKRALGVSPTGPAGGDLSGNYDDPSGPKVIALNSLPIDAFNSLNHKDGYLLGMYGGNRNLSYYGINLSQSNIFESTKLPTANQYEQKLFGDVDGYTGTNAQNPKTKVIRLNGAMIDSPTGSNNGNVLQVINYGGIPKLNYTSFKMGHFDGYFKMSKRLAPPISNQGSGTIYFDDADTCFKVSEDGRPYKKLISNYPNIRKVTKKVPIISSSQANPQIIDIDAADDVVILYANTSITSKIYLSVRPPSSTAIGVPDKKIITVCVAGCANNLVNIDVYGLNPNDVIMTGTIYNKNSTTLILDKSSSPAKWLCVDNGS